MAQMKWHSRIVKALDDLAHENFKGFQHYISHEVYIEGINGRKLIYRPDCIWWRGKSGVHIVIWEVENSPTPKSVVGDISLAALCKSRFADWYSYHEIGRELRKPVKIPRVFDSRKNRMEIENGFYHFKGSEIGRLSLFLVFRNLRYYDRYVDVMTRRQWGKISPFYKVECLKCNASSVESARRSLRKSLESIIR